MVLYATLSMYPIMDLVIFYRQQHSATWLPKALQAEHHHRSVGDEACSHSQMNE